MQASLTPEPVQEGSKEAGRRGKQGREGSAAGAQPDAEQLQGGCVQRRQPGQQLQVAAGGSGNPA